MLQNDPYPTFENLSLTQLGHLFDVSPQAVGRWLKLVGLRDLDGTPSQKARDGGLASELTLEDRSFWVWRKVPVVRLLEAAGHCRRGCTDQSDGDEIEREGSGEAGPLQLDTPCLIGPFEAKLLVDADRFDITGAGDSIGIEVKGEVLAKRTAAMLNVFWFSRKWFQKS